MALKSTWKGYLKISLVTFPIKAYSSHAGDGSPIRLNQLRAEVLESIARIAKAASLAARAPESIVKTPVPEPTLRTGVLSSNRDNSKENNTSRNRHQLYADSCLL